MRGKGQQPVGGCPVLLQVAVCMAVLDKHDNTAMCDATLAVPDTSQVNHTYVLYPGLVPNYLMPFLPRAMSISLPSRQLDMLPSVLSDDICSLRKGCERLAVSVVWALDERREVVDTWMGRTIVR